MKCLLCEDLAIAIWYFRKGCLCNASREQPLCLHHSVKSRPVGSGTKELREDLSVDKEFTRWYEKRNKDIIGENI